jgi:pSer/pThr/pTyr-binding forkhead associated (FHA) protein
MKLRTNDDRGTILESTESVRPRPAAGALVEPGAQTQRPNAAAVFDVLPEEPFRPTVRPLTPRLILLDDGEAGPGEIFRLREGVTPIGRTEGAIRLPHDPLVSARHAEIVREGTARGSRWILRDLGSANGTFVRCGRALLRSDRLLMIGSRRFRFRLADEGASVPGGQSSTMLVDVGSQGALAWPSLTETDRAASGREIVLKGNDVMIGRPGCGNTIEIDDPQLAARHARVFRSATGAWTIEALPSLNGVWVQVVEVELASPCRFQVGEHRFVFTI